MRAQAAEAMKEKWLLLITGIIAIGLIFFVYKLWYPLTVNVNLIDLPLTKYNLITFYDRKERRDISLPVSKQTKITVSQVPSDVITTLLKLKDRQFFNDNTLANLKLFCSGLTGRNFDSYTPGITLKVARNLLIVQRNAIPSIPEEAIVAYKIESSLSKEKILEAYLNNLYYGDGIFGIATAAQYYFGKDLAKLQPDEIAILVGIAVDTLDAVLKNEQNFKRKDYIEIKRNRVMDLMGAEGIISKEQVENYKKMPLKIDI
ncbi:MAG TPA: transglycosylase domain-containing protein [Bacillota bacterium]|jgi:membrane peptidoglycan carboxypeptidase|nr:transglycosylase domain-containing protein [Bacillota bacterium]HOL08640.1 transglycosylase domain-containing protein [Bacillota bacterium]HPO96658.1 transglycosylase domain-containing protein [Bacillota bacterium]